MNNLYLDLRNLIVQYVFGGSSLTPNQDLITELICMLGTLTLIALPFVLVFMLLKLLLSAIR